MRCGDNRSPLGELRVFRCDFIADIGLKRDPELFEDPHCFVESGTGRPVFESTEVDIRYTHGSRYVVLSNALGLPQGADEAPELYRAGDE